MSNICSHHIYMKMLLNLADHYNKASSEQIAVHSASVVLWGVESVREDSFIWTGLLMSMLHSDTRRTNNGSIISKRARNELIHLFFC